MLNLPAARPVKLNVPSASVLIVCDAVTSAGLTQPHGRSGDGLSSCRVEHAAGHRAGADRLLLRRGRKPQGHDEHEDWSQHKTLPNRVRHHFVKDGNTAISVSL